MIVKVIIKRTVAEGKNKTFFKALKEIRFHAMHQEGYISGETLVSAEDANRVIVISTWASLDDWHKWINSEKRQAVDQAISQYQANPTVYEPYVFSKYKAAATLGFPKSLQAMDA
ncbi:MAG: antibiotic biosynthesis monooxygenase family protein [Thermodesulfobacteriota bacterium]|nr:antibiotic biosynthesis monooxygenase family protein [Thermodesulfobacteriota bacterium]